MSLRKQEVADRLNAWIIFNEKNKELCDWLTRMENKVAHNSDLNIEEMVEKLKKVGTEGATVPRPAARFTDWWRRQCGCLLDRINMLG